MISAPALRERGHHHHRHRSQAHEVGEEGQAVHARHLDVEREHVRVEGLDLVARHQRVLGMAHDLDAGVLRQHLGQHPAHKRGVVDNQDANLVDHAALSEKFDVAGRRFLLDLLPVGQLAFDNGVVVQRAQLHHAHLAGGREVVHLARVDVAHILGDDANPSMSR